MTSAFLGQGVFKRTGTVRSRRLVSLTKVAGLALPALTLMVGCERDAFIDPSVTGRWEVTPTTVPILERLAAIEGPAGQASVETTPVRSEDLIPEVEAYRIGPGDGLEVRIADLYESGREEPFARDVDSRGYMDLPRIGRLMVDGLTEDQVRDLIVQALLEKQILTRDPLVSITVTKPRRQTYNILGAVASPGLYGIPRPDFRLLEALTGAGRFSESVPTVYVIRYIPLTEKVIRGIGPRPGGEQPAAPALPGEPVRPVTPSTPPPENLIDLIDELSRPKDQPKPAVPPGGGNPAVLPAMFGSGAQQPPVAPPPPKEPPIDLPDDQSKPAPIMAPDAGGKTATAQPAKQPDGSGATKTAADDGQPDRFWVFRDGKWIQVTKIRRTPTAPLQPMAPDAPLTPQGQPVRAEGVPPPQTVPGAEKLVTQRVIEVPMAPLLAGSAQFNIIVRPGDVIRVPSQPEGVVYISGEVNRPGVFLLPTSGRLTLTRAFVAAGGLSNLAIPGRVDLTRMIGPDRQATIRLDYRAIKEGTMPDVFIKGDDVINVGTNFWAYPLAVLRSGFRSSYGFGFILDRNFDREVFGVPPGLQGTR